MTEEDALLAAIAADPDNDTVRLAYADWLDERGGEPNARAEFIRLDTLLARLPDSGRERDATRSRLDQLLCRWDLVWHRDMPHGFRSLSGYRRGWPYRAVAVASAVRPGADDPRFLLIEELDLTVDVPPSELRDVFLHRLFLGLKSLTVRSDLPIGFGAARALAGGEFRRLERLALDRQGIGDFGLKALCEAGGFPRLLKLSVQDNNITDAGGEALLESALARKLTRLDLSGNPLSGPVRKRMYAAIPGLF